MPLITSAGIGSGLDLESIISASVDAENVPKMNAFAAKDEALQVELSAIGEVKSALSQLQDTIEKLADPDNFNKRVANITQPTSDDGDLISVTPTSDITPGDFKIEVVAIAQGSRALSEDGLFATNEDVVSASGGTLSFSAGPDKTFDLTLDAGATLSDLRDAINDSDSNFGVTANIINTGSEAKLVLTSTVTGTGNDLVITNDNAELDNVSTVANAGGAGGIGIAAENTAKDAIIKVDGITITNDTNTFKDAVQDMTITAKRESVDNETAKLSVDFDRESATTLVDELITNYNNVIGQLGFQSRIGKPLNSDSTIRSLSSQLVNALSTSLTDAGPFESIFDIGLGVDKEGYLEKSTLVRSLNDALDNNFDDIGKAFAGENGIASKFEELLNNYVDTNGIMKQREDSLNGQISELEDDVENHQFRMESLEARLREQYAGLDVLLAQMQSTQTYLSAQLASLPGFTRSDS
ncbi:MAG: flagellar filament capping protein FliD [Pseudoalteromonas tetraodonis]|jgi:flagellar hook-associated protein 2|uniref:Flagellar hook-associated protein 2 n=1 Tax=Pseudoalteromonas marina TaxID=267375 RepID=A0ABT9F9F1_9GAMM|nr:flagellar filament capping protein FliD [Pseudoalteromonas marina]EAW27945.1 Flagellar capping protein [Alteromonadales bacterium TW-7]MBL1386283.1 flagellar filament capping protein FliD [Colwellia sp.]KAF7779751.1 flagellar hook-associated protein 2 [Pseudoalteromonas marina]MDP2484376.1 flagellar filament capping protein FliD [Pseudoalteromonas marina]MDP2563358.1 flagellar filament capping protein FliD [Pseudoalteromonas marina]|tara:strand:- start:3365 stop:4771 length:1407 start_codon:yes stop_codon:yes gene_type:complete